MAKIIYITSWYNEKNLTRAEELRICVQNTINSKDIDKVYLLNENSAPHNFYTGESSPYQFTNGCKLQIIPIEERPTFAKFFNVANNVAEKGDIVIIANTDIYPEEGMRELIKNIGDNDCYALARYDIQEDGSKVLLNRWDAQDLWVFKAPIKENIECDFENGRAGSDNAIAERLHRAGYNVSNPSRSIKFNHLHTSQVHNYNPDHKVPKPYILITPHHLGENPSLHAC